MIIAAALMGGLGAVCRFLVDTAINRRNRLTIPVGTIVVNVTACLLMGLLAGWALSHVGSDEVRALLGSGLLGGYSTFSTASVEGVRILRSGRHVEAIAHTGGMLVLSLAATLAGYALMV
ncbi:CrcB family protein [uncultured Bifidobacterium sp.]|uniref:fluoride efflux transporter FluC n=1 Tax=uncultured Bifidobacterium sp. TaxID=165187 RepID=UPI00261723E6|nr:CrcB family protein [uncultured Bifidobacterium sp.]